MILTPETVAASRDIRASLKSWGIHSTARFWLRAVCSRPQPIIGARFQTRQSLQALIRRGLAENTGGFASATLAGRALQDRILELEQSEARITGGSRTDIDGYEG
mgnify:FL=1